MKFFFKGQYCWSAVHEKKLVQNEAREVGIGRMMKDIMTMVRDLGLEVKI